ncbi:hypothetical protein PFISCL1PPCAC_9016, partial [Pristionchus fissidentatus]
PSPTLEMLPKENLFKIISFLTLRDRKTLHECSETLKEAVQQSDLYVKYVYLNFEKFQSHDLQIAVGVSPDDIPESINVDRNDSESIRRWLSNLRKRLFFRRLIADRLQIACGSELVEASILEHIAAQFDYRSFQFQFYSRNQQGVLNFALRSKKRIDTFCAYYFSPDPHEIIELPRMSDLQVDHMTPGFSDEQVLAIARKEHITASIRGDLSHATTLLRLIQMVRSSNLILEMQIIVPSTVFHRFLSSIGLREEGNVLMDVSEPNSPVFWLEWDRRSLYFLDTG